MSLNHHPAPADGNASPAEAKPGWKARFRREMVKYWLTVLYLAIYFGAFTNYRRLILAQYQISYLNYGYALIEAMVLGKVILVGDLMRLDRGFAGRPLIFPTLFKSFMFSIWVMVFNLLEYTVKGLFRGEGWLGGLNSLANRGKYEYFASALVVFFTFMPFFALKELNRATGDGKLWQLFFRKRESAVSG